MKEFDDQITAAIGAHGMWKNRLKMAITNGTADTSASSARDDHACNFGKWLHGSDLGPEMKKTSQYKNCAEFHRRFHIVASEVLALALSGKRDEAAAAMGSGKEFAKLSSDLTNSMLAWKAHEAKLSPAAR